MDTIEGRGYRGHEALLDSILEYGRYDTVIGAMEYVQDASRQHSMDLLTSIDLGRGARREEKTPGREADALAGTIEFELPPPTGWPAGWGPDDLRDTRDAFTLRLRNESRGAS